MNLPIKQCCEKCAYDINHDFGCECHNPDTPIQPSDKIKELIYKDTTKEDIAYDTHPSDSHDCIFQRECRKAHTKVKMTCLSIDCPERTGGECTSNVIDDRLFKRIEITATCWNWLGFIRKDGYGVLAEDTKHKSINRYAHRLVYESLVGKIPKNLQLDHLCRNRKCVNPEHLEAVTQKENILRGESRPAKNSRKTHCPQGHPYDGYNLIKRRGYRECRICRDLNNQIKYANKKRV